MPSTLMTESQRLVIDLADLQTATFTEAFYAALKEARWEPAEKSPPFVLANIFKHNPCAAAPFIHEAVQWQKLCDLLLLDDDPDRETVLVLQNINRATPKVLQEIRRTLRFHELHALNRRFEERAENGEW